MKLEQKRMNLFTQLYKSIFDYNSYRYFKKLSMGRAILYLFFTTLIIGSLGLVKPTYDFKKNASELTDVFMNKVPNFTFENGELKVYGDMPIIVEEKDETIIIDTTGKTDETILNKYKTGIFISKNKFVEKNSNVEQLETKFNKLFGIAFSKQDLEGMLPMLNTVNVFVFIIGLLVYFFGKLFSGLIVALTASIVTSSKRMDMRFETLYKLSIFALTLPSILKVIVQSTGEYLPFFDMIYYTIALIYVIKAILLKNKEDKIVSV